MKHEIYSCDWCGDPAPKLGSYPAEWRSFDGDAEYLGLSRGTAATLMPTMLLCQECQRARADAIQKARLERRAPKYKQAVETTDGRPCCMEVTGHSGYMNEFCLRPLPCPIHKS